ncbi:hypothetical protein D9758_006732 [Tetrapyrgos nigripes]|uniref:Uncharacterized protein n=1 Tax=Tetrapyrgos nigripes TaxID=182062 RepID=A0A8H5GJQ6_9AGAR|nr:hypothetical protein D9758_006732 [Tetrapyrgos nigripes]
MYPQLRLLKESLSSPQQQRDRLRSALPLIRANIPCIIWAEDALNFVHRVPTLLFDQQLIVPSNQVDAAVDAICAGCPDYLVGTIELDSRWKDLANGPGGGGGGGDDDGNGAGFTPSVLLVNSNSNSRSTPNYFIPTRIIIHAASTFHFNVDDPSRTCANPLFLDNDGDHTEAQASSSPSYDAFRYPTPAAFCDIVIDTIHEPPLGDSINKELLEHLKLLLAHLILYTIADEGCTTFPEPDDDDGRAPRRAGPNMDMTPQVKPLKIIPACEKLLEEMKEENRPFLRRIFRHNLPPNREEECRERMLIKQERLKRLGQTYIVPAIPFNPDRVPMDEAHGNTSVPTDETRRNAPVHVHEAHHHHPMPVDEAQRSPPPYSAPSPSTPREIASTSTPWETAITKFKNFFKLPSPRYDIQGTGDAERRL